MGWTLAVPTLAALAAYVVAAFAPDDRASTLRGALLAGWLAHAVAIVVDIAGIGAADTGARFGFAPALSVTMWLVLAVYAVESRFVPLSGVRRTLAELSAKSIVVKDLTAKREAGNQLRRRLLLLAGDGWIHELVGERHAA